MRHGLVRALKVFGLTMAFGLLLRALAAGLASISETPGLMVAIGLMSGAFGVCAASLAWYLFRQTNTLLTRRINQALFDFRRRLSVEQVKYERAQRHLYQGYVQWFDHADIDTAIAHFERAVRTFPHGLGGYVALGYAYYHRGETEKAFDMLEQAIAIYPDRKEPYRDLASLLIREGDLLRALDYIEQAVRVDPSVRRDLLEDPLFDILKHEIRTRERYERALTG